MAKNLVGKTLGQYELVEIAGEGGLATVYKAYQRSLERWVAVKVLHVREKEVLARFKREARATALLRHRNILMVYEYGEEQGWPYIAMEYVEGGTLENYLQGEPMDWLRVVELMSPIADALHYAHQHGLIHRDVKPSNILMPQPDWPLLTDFGLVKVLDAEQSLTMTGVVIGTPAYIAPEQAMGKTADLRADIYSLGVVMFEMITGRWPFEYENANRLMLAHVADQPPLPSELNPDCPSGLEQIILTAMQKSPDDRYPDMQAMVNELETLTGRSTLPLPSISPLDAEASQTFSEFPPRPPLAPLAPPPDRSPVQVAQILISDKNVTIDLPHPGEDGLIIGRTHAQNQVDIDLGPYGAAEAGVSRRHARLSKQGSEWLLDDLGSLNGTYINNVKLKTGLPIPLKDGDVVRCSLLSFIFRLPQPD